MSKWEAIEESLKALYPQTWEARIAAMRLVPESLVDQMTVPIRRQRGEMMADPRVDNTPSWRELLDPLTEAAAGRDDNAIARKDFAPPVAGPILTRVRDSMTDPVAMPKPEKKIIGIAGRKRSGKNTLADMLAIQAFGNVEIMSMAEPLKDELANAIGGYSDAVVAGIRKAMDDDSTKEDFREALQFWGTNLRRKFNGGDYWVRQMLDRIRKSGADVIVIPDIRFPNEVAMVKALGGAVVRIERSDVPDDNTSAHASETALDGYAKWDAVINNTGTLNDLADAAGRLCEDLHLTGPEFDITVELDMFARNYGQWEQVGHHPSQLANLLVAVRLLGDKLLQIGGSKG